MHVDCEDVHVELYVKIFNIFKYNFLVEAICTREPNSIPAIVRHAQISNTDMLLLDRQDKQLKNTSYDLVQNLINKKKTKELTVWVDITHRKAYSVFLMITISRFKYVVCACV
jgi:ABC-type iron transport system FetAB ATPase subunit